MRGWLWFLGGGLLGAWFRSDSQAPPAGPPPAAPEDGSERQERLQAAEKDLQRREMALDKAISIFQSSHSAVSSQASLTELQELAARQLAQAMQRIVPQVVGEHCLSTVDLPSDDYKGRIIGKEGRNLRLFESLTGVDLVIDDNPCCVSLSCFDPWRRELAHLALKQLLQHGRFQPKRIEEAVTQARQAMEKITWEKGQAACRNLGLAQVARPLQEALGRLAFRSSYRQNVLEHSLEVAWLAAHLATELGADVEVCKRAGLFHDLGKGQEGQVKPHALVSGDMCRNFGESEAVSHAAEAHHEDVPQRTLEAILVQVADAVSASRPGARQDNAQEYWERLQTLERLAQGLSGVLDCQVVQAGREIRVFVRPDLVDDEQCSLLAQELAEKIQSSSKPPGPVRISIIRQFQAGITLS